MTSIASFFAQITTTHFVVFGIVVLCLIGFVFLIMLFNFGALWFQGFMSGAQVSLLSLVGMSLRKVNSRIIMQAKIMAKQSGLPISGPMGITNRRLEAHYLAGGSVPKVIQALIVAQRASLDLNFDQAAAIDLAGRDVLEAVRTSVNPKVIACPDPKKGNRTILSAIAKNGVELQVSAKVTVRTNLERLIGGATEDTIIARVGEGIITAIGSSETHFEVMENPDSISRAVLTRGLDSQTAFQIVSIDIAKIEVGQNIGARLQVDQAEADTRVAQAKAEERRALALAVAQEMKAKVAENRAIVIAAEAGVPHALAAAFRKAEPVTN
ncbi:MAG: flotillin-like protein FloA [Planctomycetaceae bacterium]|nr:flotillin-like protein FloA [Planctomycetaceae bacterium]